MLPFTLQQLRILKAVATEKNFTKAAEVLYLSQPYISIQIKSLEQNLDVILVDRNSTKFSLTESGEVLLQYSDRILALCEESCRALIELKNGDRGRLILGASPIVGTYLLPQILALLTQNYPQINLNIKINSTKIISKYINNNQIDLAIVEDKIPNNLQKNLNIDYFVEDELNLIVSKSHPFAKKTEIKKEDLYYLKFIGLNSSSNLSICQSIENILNEKNISLKHLKIVLKLNSIEAIKIAVSLGLGVAFVPSLTIEKELKLQTIKILKIKNIKLTRRLYILSNSKTFKSKAFKIFYNGLITLKNSF